MKADLSVINHVRSEEKIKQTTLDQLLQKNIIEEEPEEKEDVSKVQVEDMREEEWGEGSADNEQ
ncbi:hypothetical protein E2C01_092862 [Portunus trituberculatus]|uniref:Uncharacterized protein n=1 Tax=Portunus trituberculatus TaxID=210409 RepID=A0A5B7JT14_PORTR|nr:hypothetical protein [Portunus trituberculatus]